MKNVLKILISVLTAISLMTVSIGSFSAAETYYKVDGYTYRFISSGKIALFDWDNSSNTLVVPEKIEDYYFAAIDDYAFRNNEVIEYVDLSKATSLVTIGLSSFEASALKSITIPEWVTLIDDYAFQRCESLKSVEINANVTKINVQAFNRCSALSYVKLPDSLESIEKFAFGYCSSLKKIVIPKSVTSIAETAFKADKDLTIYCYKDSYAAEYAETNNIPYVLLDAEYALGDVDMDGRITISDATLIQRYKAEMEKLTDVQIKLADADGNGTVNISDATRIQYIVAELI